MTGTNSMTPAAQAQTMDEAVRAAQAAAGTGALQLKDHDGKAHTYVITQHGLDEGLDIVGLLLTVCGGPLGAVMKDTVGKLVDEGQDGDVMDIVAAVDWSAVGQDVATVAKQVKLSVFAEQILRRTLRDGQPLGNDAVRNLAYRGNYMELYHALWVVIKANNFVSFSTTS